MPKPFHRTRHTWLLYLVFAIFGYAINCLGPITPFLKAELDLSYTVSSLHFSALAAGSIPAGFGGHWLVARLGRKGVLWGCLLGLGASALALAAGRVAWVTLGASFLMGCFGSLLTTVIPSGLADEHGENRSIPMTESNLIASISSAAAPVLIGWFASTVVGWRFALAIPLAAALMLGLGMGRTAMLGASPMSQTEHDGGRLPGQFWIFWLAIFFAVAIEYCMLSWCADYLEHTAGLAKAVAAQAVSVFLAGLILGRLFGIRLLRSFTSTQVVTASLLICAAGFLLYWSASAAWMVIAGLLITGLGVACQFPLALALALGAAEGHTVQASTRTTLASGIAILTLPLILGRLADLVGIRLAYGVVMILVAASLVLVRLSARRVLPRPSPLGSNVSD